MSKLNLEYYNKQAFSFIINEQTDGYLKGTIELSDELRTAFFEIQHEMDEEYFDRIDAMQYALAHDDGQAYWNLKEADIILLGVSRTSKTPTCIYIANRGLKAANVPYVPGVALPDELMEIGEFPGPLVVGLTKDPKSLVQIRKNRLRSLNEDDNTDYIDIETVKQEVIGCRRVCAEHGWPVIDVSRRSIEETAAAAIKLYETRQSKRIGDNI